MVVPMIGPGVGLTVKVAFAVHPVDAIVYVIVVVPPGLGPPVTIVVGETVAVFVTVAIAVALLLHVPPPVASANVVVWPVHMPRLPVMAAGNGLTTTDAVV